jgi:polar amino acid transport system substrate-binding protein
MRSFVMLLSVFGWIVGAEAGAVEEGVMKQLAPTGKIRVGVAFAPSPTPLFVVKDAHGEAKGVPLVLAAALAKELGVESEIVVMATTGELTEACKSGAIDIGFMPVDEERRKAVDFSPPYFVIESTYLVAGRPDIKSLADVDRSDVTVVGINGSTTMRSATKSLSTAHVVAAKSVDEAMAMMKAGSAQAFALTHDSLPALQKQLPGSRIMDGAFQVTGVAIAVQKNRPEALAYVTDFMKNAKASGMVRRVLDDAGFKDVPVAP